MSGADTASNTASGALSGAGTGAAIGSVIPGVGTAIGAGAGAVIGGVAGYLKGRHQSDADKIEARRRALLYGQAQEAGGEADESYNAYRGLGDRGNASLDQLQALANGQNSVSAEQLRQGLQQQLGQQQSIAAGVSPRNAAMAARTAAIQSARLGSGLAGQQAIAGLQERNAAQGQYSNLLQALRGQELQQTLGSRQNALSGYGAGNTGQLPQSDLQKYGPAIQGGLQALGSYYGSSGGGGGGQSLSSMYPHGGDDSSGPITSPSQVSDRRQKTNIKPGDEQADRALGGLKAHFYEYKDESNGKGPRIGVMTDDLKKAGLGHAVINTPRGEMVHPAALATSLAAMMPGIRDRLEKLEAKAAPSGKAKRVY